MATEARRTHRSRSAIVQAFTEETARTRRSPGLGFRGDGAARRAWVIGSGLDAWEIAQIVEVFRNTQAVLPETHLTERQVRLALACRDAFPDVIEAIRALMVAGFAWDLIGQALLSILIMGAVLQAGTLWAFNRVSR